MKINDWNCKKTAIEEAKQHNIVLGQIIVRKVVSANIKGERDEG